MQRYVEASRGAAIPEAARTTIWIVLVAASSVLFSLALACATPFAALATIAATKMSRRDGAALIAASWLANQAIGYFVLDYPRTWDSFAWGAAIGVAALLAMLAARAATRRSMHPIAALAVAFVLAAAVYELALFAATSMLPSGEDAFSLSVVAQIVGINALALAGLTLLHRLALMAGLVASRPPTTIRGLPA